MEYFTKGRLIFILLAMLMLQCKEENANKNGGNLTEVDQWFSKLPDLTSDEKEMFQGVYVVELYQDFADEYAPDAKIHYSYMDQCGYLEPNGKVFRLRYTNNDQEILFDVKRESDILFVFKRGQKYFSARHPIESQIVFILSKDGKYESHLRKTKLSYQDCHEDLLNIFKSGG